MSFTYTPLIAVTSVKYTSSYASLQIATNVDINSQTLEVAKGQFLCSKILDSASKTKLGSNKCVMMSSRLVEAFVGVPGSWIPWPRFHT